MQGRIRMSQMHCLKKKRILKNESYLLAVRVKSSERVSVHVSSERHHTGVRGAQQSLSQSQDGGEVPSHHLRRHH